jgi:hypothetical protein
MQDTYKTEALKRWGKRLSRFVTSWPLILVSPEETQARFDTNVFNLLNTMRAFLPMMQAQRSGSFPTSPVRLAGSSAASGFSVVHMGRQQAKRNVDLRTGRLQYQIVLHRTMILPLETSQYGQSHCAQTADCRLYWDCCPGDLRRPRCIQQQSLGGHQEKTKSGDRCADCQDIPLCLVLRSDALDIVNGKCGSTMELLS